MRYKDIIIRLVVLIILLLSVGKASAQEPAGDVGAQAAVGTAFTYQGRLTDAGGPVNGTCDLRFQLYSAASGGTLLGTDTVNGVPVSDGYFGVVLNDDGEFGPSAFTGDARWLEIRVNCGSGDTDLSPRQPLTAAPYAHYALGAPWSGLSGVPAGLDDGDDDTTYTAGTGLTLSGGQFSLVAGYRLPQGCANGQIAEWNGSAWACGNDDVGTGGGPHNHLGETWTGNNNPLVIEGTFSDAPLVLGNDDGLGLYIHRAGDAGVYVDSAGGDGVYVHEAGGDGVYVHEAGSPSMTAVSSLSNGIEVAGAEGDGLFVGRADFDGVDVYSAGDDGVDVYSAGDDGVSVISAGNDGVVVGSAGDDGVYVGLAGSPSTWAYSSLQNGFEVAGAQGNGLYVGGADLSGVYVDSAGGDGVYMDSVGDDGVYVDSAGDDGVVVGSAGYDGVVVGSAGDDGMVVGSAGSPSTWAYSSLHNGFVVAGAEGHGLYVGRADVNGVEVNSAGYDGIYVLRANRRAATFNGDVLVTGNLSKGSGSFKIDHPLDPENQYLNHAFVESPDMKNIYDGVVVLDANGQAWVELPAWFEALNRDFRYQLTPIGGPGPNLYVARKIQDNRFKIAGGAPGLEVSWQVTGIRHDPYAEANPIPVEEDKSAEEQGTYLHPEAYGQPETMGLIYQDAQNLALEQESGPEQPALAEPPDHPIGQK